MEWTQTRGLTRRCHHTPPSSFRTTDSRPAKWSLRTTSRRIPFRSTTYRRAKTITPRSISIRTVNEVHTPHSEGFFETDRNHGLFQLTHSGGSEISKMKCGRQSTRESVGEIGRAHV